ncbi:hypothetical protein D9758_005647 [Tetrapyrgos nigripes]|uniref:NmrA-like domain-containing protein n=1 Tax=Tetrapyrgos nigripes TaxID=182062 RepID=A0A8H5LP17_9AGAR|nr:hypothetical protein D9758_005647 [Tetrapyrgos nigripes]
MAPRTKILLTGATGYIGGSILNRFLARPDFQSSFDIRVLVRSPEKAPKFDALGFKSIVGSHTDEEVMVQAVSEVDIVVGLTDCDSIPAAELTIKGLKKHFEETGKQAFFIQTSGTGVYVQLTNGMYTTDVIYDDANPDQIETLAPTQPHRNVDLKILSAENEGFFKSCIVLPSLVYGVATGPLFDSGLSNPHSILIPLMCRVALDRRRAGMIGQGKNVWPNVDINEVADFYPILIEKIIQSPDTVPHGREGIYNLENDKHTSYDVAEAIGKALVALGYGDDSTPLTFTPEEEKKYFGAHVHLIGSDCRCIATRARSFGWDPKLTTADMLGGVQKEIEILIKTGKAELKHFVSGVDPGNIQVSSS